jgi:5-formyltetrahydrofolate cyclo-ligase
MVGPSLTPSRYPAEAQLDDKQLLRARMRKARREHVAALPAATRALLFRRPPAPIAAFAPEGTTIGLYHAGPDEAPTRGYAQWLYENGRRIALPWFADREKPMQFREWRDPWNDEGLEAGPWGTLQPAQDAPEALPSVIFAPLLAFAPNGARLGQGGGHYDRWLAENPGVVAVGLAWDCQHVDHLPLEPHDRPLRAIVTPTRFYEGAD